MIDADIFIIIPAYNEAGRLGQVIQELQQEYANVVVVDDGSTDDTSNVVRRHGCLLLRHSINRGQGAALQTGITYCLRNNAKFLVTFDADGQHQMTDLPAMLAPVRKGEVDVVLGSRFLKNTSNVPIARRLVLQTARLFTWAVSGMHLSDCHNGFRVFSRHAAQHIMISQDRMAHASELYDQIRSAKLSYTEVPVSIRYSSETLAKGQSVLDAPNIILHYLFGKITK